MRRIHKIRMHRVILDIVLDPDYVEDDHASRRAGAYLDTYIASTWKVQWQLAIKTGQNS